MFKSTHFKSLVGTPLKINQFNMMEVKATLDDQVAKYFSLELDFKEDSTTFWVKLALGYFNCLIAGVTALYSYVTPFNESRLVCSILVFLFFAGTILHQFYNQDSSIIFKGYKKASNSSKTMVKVSSIMSKGSPIYTLSFDCTKQEDPLPNPRPKSHPVLSEISVENYFDVDGHLDVKSLAETLSSLTSKRLT